MKEEELKKEESLSPIIANRERPSLFLPGNLGRRAREVALGPPPPFRPGWLETGKGRGARDLF